MVQMLKVRGIDRVQKMFKRAKKKIPQRFRKGLIKAGLFLQAASQKIVPVDTANLKNSAFTRAEGSVRRPTVRVGYTAEYAIYVHEDLTANHAVGKTAKYLETPARVLRKDMVRIINDEVKT